MNGVTASRRTRVCCRSHVYWECHGTESACLHKLSHTSLETFYNVAVDQQELYSESRITQKSSPDNCCECETNYSRNKKICLRGWWKFSEKSVHTESVLRSGQLPSKTNIFLIHYTESSSAAGRNEQQLWCTLHTDQCKSGEMSEDALKKDN